MRQNQAFGIFLVAVAVLIFFCIVQLWTRTRKDPMWIIRGELRDLVRPTAIQVVNALLLLLGGAAGSASFLFGLWLLRWV